MSVPSIRCAAESSAVLLPISESSVTPLLNDLANPTSSRIGEAHPRRQFGDGPVSGAAVMIAGKIANFGIAFISIAIVARLLTPADYGLVAMVASATAFFSIFADFGLSLVTVQRPHLSHEQHSTLFWINVAFGLLLGTLAAALGPALVWFYGDVRLLSVTLALAIVFPVAALGTQHEALLKRNMKFRRLASVRLLSSIVSAAAGIAAAFLGWGYWALVVQPLALAASATIMFWLAVHWMPSRPARCEGLRGMLGFGGALTAHGMIGYFANNMDSILIGRFWGDAILGLYATSYNLMMRPVSLAGYGVGEAAIPSLSRAAAASEGLPSAFRRMFAVSCVLGLPMFLVGVIWPDDIVRTLLGAKWTDATAIIPWLFLAGLARMLMVPTGWIYVASGRPKRMLAWQLMWTPFVLLSFVVGLPYGPVGVAACYAGVNCLGLGFSYAFCFRGTDMHLSDVFVTLLAPTICAVGCALAATIVQVVAASSMVPGPWRLVVRLAIAVVLYSACTARFVPMARAGLTTFLKRVQPA